MGVFGGASHSTVKTLTASVDTASDSVFAGVYGQYASGHWLVNGALSAGYVRHVGKRSVLDSLSGLETATSAYHSTYISPSVTVIRNVDLGAGLSLRPSATLNYTYGRLSSYVETGTTRSNLSVGSRNARVLNGRVQLAVRQELADHQGEFEVRAGAIGSTYGDDKVKIALQGGPVANQGMNGAGNSSGGFVGVGGRFQLKNNLSVVGDLEFTESGGNSRATVGYLGMEYRF